MDTLDRRIINELQGDFPVCEHPYRAVADRLGSTESEIITRIGCMLDDGLLTRFGPMFHAEHMGGALSLCALRVPQDRFEAVADMVNACPEVAHNYQRDHAMNMWFVLATETPAALQAAIDRVESQTGLRVFNLPKLEEFFVGLHFEV
ncbi:MAG: AsnC family transcriptional regulator [Gammaproteobacteria bacterium]